MKKLTHKESINLLKAWSALEILSPQTFLKPESLTGGDAMSIIMLDDQPLPWENKDNKTNSKGNFFYHIIIGTINFEKAIEEILKQFPNNQAEKSTATGQAIIGVLTVNHQGHPVLSNLSSFAWGINHVLQRNLESLSLWSDTEKDSLKKLEELFYEKDENDNLIPITRSKISKLLTYLVDLFHIPEALLINQQFLIKTYEPSGKKESIPQLLLNSFYLEDLEKAKDSIISGHVPEALQRYLGLQVPEERYNILNNNALLEKIIAPGAVSLSRWPSPSHHSLVLLQQAAVNVAHSELKDQGILAVNGPPGTGKTTLLKDIIASIITDRAQALLKFDDPEQAFIDTNFKISSGKGSLNLYKLDPSLKGFEILIASSNNKAVQNVSAELPSINSIDDQSNTINYFSNLATELINAESWGLISAVLGNASNRQNFLEKFWNDKDHGMLAYLFEACGIPQFVDVNDPDTGYFCGTRSPKIVLKNDPPHNHEQALIRWQHAKLEFSKALQACQQRLNELENIRSDLNTFETLKENLNLKDTELKDLIAQHKKLKPNFIKRILRLPSVSRWQEKLNILLSAYDLENKITSFPDDLKPYLIDKKFFLKNHGDKNKVSPWNDPITIKLRNEVFIQSLKLSKAFIDAAAKPLRNNLGILMKGFLKQNPVADLVSNKDDLKVLTEVFPDLWSSLFLVVPAVSTTFASVNKMLSTLPLGYLGWLIVDEAGQASPQAAVGAIMRSKRLIVTGDPLQIEPVVILPEKLTDSICNQFYIDAQRFNPPKASVQTLADTATAYYTEFSTSDGGTRHVGFPLLVHRRCSDPMFSIANAIAYERLMVKVKHPKPSEIRNCLGNSRWIHISEESNHDKWCPAEGLKVIEILKQIKSSLIFPDIYIISPFKIVADNLRYVIQQSGVMNNWQDVNPYIWLKERVGTVHTVQGREADSVILVLGASNARLSWGARSWAGKTPNILNVAVTRAKENLYVIGNRDVWKQAGLFEELSNRLTEG